MICGLMTSHHISRDGKPPPMELFRDMFTSQTLKSANVTGTLLEEFRDET
jgi:hypothetical protein